MLNAIVSRVTQFTEVIATVTGIDIEVVDTSLVRVAGTGIHAAGVGKSMESAGQLYSHALTHNETLFVDNPKEHELCQKCRDQAICKEKLTMCSPIVIGGEIAGIIGLLCYTDADRDKVLKNREVYLYFIRQMADAIGRTAESEQNARETRQRLDMLLHVTDSNNRCVLVVNADNGVSFVNDAARQELGLTGPESEYRVDIAASGEMYSGMESFDLVITDGAGQVTATFQALGRLATLGNDAVFSRALVFDSKRRFAEMVSQLSGSSDNTEVLDSIVGASSAIRELKQRVLQIAATTSTVLITGESGTGKEMFARAIHAASQRKDKPFVAINCGAIPDALLESELFGYVRGAFTDANPSGRMGKFELADQGVLFLDEISSMPLYLQVKLLRILQERNFTRLGSNKPIHVDLRIIAATNESLPTLIGQRRFREDLYYRLNVIPLELPPLRERRDDIPVLAQAFMQRYCRLFGKPEATLTDRAMERLVQYDWPGNIRELENCIEYMVNMHQGGAWVPPAVLPAQLQERVEMVEPAYQALVPPSAGDTAVVPLPIAEQTLIRRALEHYGSDTEGKRKAAQALGISLATLYRKLKET